jgi:hypothetical protein
MSIRNCVLIFGKSLNLVGLGACLKQDESLEVRFFDPEDLNVEKYVKELNPEAIIFDLSDQPDNLEMALLRNCPGLLLIGVDPSSDEVFVLKGQRSKVVTAGELSRLIAEHTGEETEKNKQQANGG